MQKTPKIFSLINMKLTTKIPVLKSENGKHIWPFSLLGGFQATVLYKLPTKIDTQNIFVSSGRAHIFISFGDIKKLCRQTFFWFLPPLWVMILSCKIEILFGVTYFWYISCWFYIYLTMQLVIDEDPCRMMHISYQKHT